MFVNTVVYGRLQFLIPSVPLLTSIQDLYDLGACLVAKVATKLDFLDSSSTSINKVSIPKHRYDPWLQHGTNSMSKFSHLWAGWHQNICVIQLLSSILGVCPGLDKTVVNLVKCANNPQNESTMGCSHMLHKYLQNLRRCSGVEALILASVCIELSGQN